MNLGTYGERMKIEFVVPGQPHGKARPRFARGRVHSDPVSAAYEQSVGYSARYAMGPAKPLEGPLSLQIDAVATPPASWSKKRRERAASGFEYPTTRPDIDNIVKAILDGCNGVAFLDDKQVVEVSAAKRYGYQACVFVQITAMADQAPEAKAVIEKASAA